MLLFCLESDELDQLSDFHNILLKELMREKSDSGVSLDDAFFERMTGLLEDEGEIETTDRIGFSAHASGKTLRIDGMGGHPKEAGGILSVIVCDFYSESDPIKINAQAAKKSFSHLINFVAAARRTALHDDLIDGSSEAGAAKTISFSWSSIVKIKLILITNAIYSARTDAVLAGTIAGTPVTYNIWDLNRFQRYETSGQTREKLEVNFKDFGTSVPALAASNTKDGLDSYLIIIAGSQLAEIYDKWGARLLEANVRSFLQARGVVNRGIRDTIRDEPEMFFSYNNGLSATADSVLLEKTDDGLRIVSARNFQILNGSQTAASLHAPRKISPETLNQVHVQVKLTVVPSETSDDIVPFISKYANSQNKVSAADFFSNHPFHLRMEEYSR